MLTIEDSTGRIKAVVSQNKKELHAKAKDLVLDEVVGIIGISGDKIIFVEDVILLGHSPYQSTEKRRKGRVCGFSFRCPCRF